MISRYFFIIKDWQSDKKNKSLMLGAVLQSAKASIWKSAELCRSYDCDCCFRPVSLRLNPVIELINILSNNMPIYAWDLPPLIERPILKSFDFLLWPRYKPYIIVFLFIADNRWKEPWTLGWVLSLSTKQNRPTKMGDFVLLTIDNILINVACYLSSPTHRFFK